MESKKKVKSLSRVQLFATPWTVACQAPLFLGFSRQEYGSRLPFPLPEDLHCPGIKPASPVSPTLTGRFFTTEPPGKSNSRDMYHQFYRTEFGLLWLKLQNCSFFFFSCVYNGSSLIFNFSFSSSYFP